MSEKTQSPSPGGPPRLVRRVEQGRLVYYMQHADAAYWDAHWDTQLSERVYRSARRGRLGMLEPILRRWLPRQGRILEAGCGMAQYVVALRARGYDVEGVDYTPETVRRVQQMLPDLPIRQQDVTRLDCPDGYYAGYISLGVVEHRREGPQPFLEEAYRVLQPGGVAIITVPCFHGLRRWKARRGMYDQQPTDLPFYQYAYAPDEIASLVTQAGLQVVGRHPYDGFKGIKDEVRGAKPLLRGLQRVPVIGWLTQRWLRSSRLGHMIAIVARKPGRTIDSHERPPVETRALLHPPHVAANVAARGHSGA